MIDVDNVIPVFALSMPVVGGQMSSSFNAAIAAREVGALSVLITCGYTQAFIPWVCSTDSDVRLGCG